MGRTRDKAMGRTRDKAMERTRDKAMERTRLRAGHIINAKGYLLGFTRRAPGYSYREGVWGGTGFLWCCGGCRVVITCPCHHNATQHQRRHKTGARGRGSRVRGSRVRGSRVRVSRVRVSRV